MKASDKPGSIQAATTVYKVTVTPSGAAGTDASSITGAYGKAGDSVSIDYTLDNSGTGSNTLTYSGAASGPGQVAAPGKGTSTYSIDSGDAKDGVIALTATFAHTEKLALTGTVTLELDPKTGQVTASAADGNISTAGDLTYTWSGGASGTGTTATPTPGTETICTVKGTNTTGSIEAKITVYKVAITTLGAVENDAIGTPALYGEAGDDVQIAYILDKLGTQLDMLTFDGAKNNPSTVMEAGTDKATYKIDSADAKSGVIGLFAWFEHMYSLSVNLDGGNGKTESMGVKGGFAIDINAGTKSGYTFSGWTSSGGGTFANASSAKTEFTAPYSDTTITASWTQSNTGGGGSSTTSTPTVTTSTTGSGSSAVTTATTEVKGTTSGGAQFLQPP